MCVRRRFWIYVAAVCVGLTLAELAMARQPPRHAPTPQSMLTGTLTIHVAAQVYAGMPIWVSAHLEGTAVIFGYPAYSNPCNFGSNELELKRDGVEVAAQPCGMDYASALVDRIYGERDIRLPLHLKYPALAAGNYSVRLVARPYGQSAPAFTSGWIDFRMLTPVGGQREAWLKSLLAQTPPANSHDFVVNYLLPILAAAPDPRVLDALTAVLTAPRDASPGSHPVGELTGEQIAVLDSLRFFPQDQVRARALEGNAAWARWLRLNPNPGGANVMLP